MVKDNILSTNTSVYSTAMLLYIYCFSSLEDNCFTMFCWFLPHITMNQPQVYMCPLPPTSHCTPRGCRGAPALGSLHHTARSCWLSVLHLVIHVSMLLSTCPTLSFPHCRVCYFLFLMFLSSSRSSLLCGLSSSCEAGTTL